MLEINIKTYLKITPIYWFIVLFRSTISFYLSIYSINF